MKRFFALVALPLSLSIPAFAEPSFEVTRQNGIEFAKPHWIPLLLDLYLPKGVENPALVVWIHGGGWKGGSRAGNKMAWVAKHGYAMASIEYRMSKQFSLPRSTIAKGQCAGYGRMPRNTAIKPTRSLWAVVQRVAISWR